MEALRRLIARARHRARSQQRSTPQPSASRALPGGSTSLLRRKACRWGDPTARERWRSVLASSRASCLRCKEFRTTKAKPMKAVFIEQYGGPDVLKYGDLPDALAGPGEVVVDAVAASVNAADWKRRRGQLQPAKIP